MGEKTFTLVELHFDGEYQLGPQSLPGLGSRSDDSGADDEDTLETESADAESSDDGRGLGPLVVGAIAMIAIAVAVRRYRRDESEPDSFDERDVVVN